MNPKKVRAEIHTTLQVARRTEAHPQVLEALLGKSKLTPEEIQVIAEHFSSCNGCVTRLAILGLGIKHAMDYLHEWYPEGE